MPATPAALYSQNSSQSGTTVAGAFPQVTPNGVGNQNLDLIQIVAKGKGNAILASVDYLGNVSVGLVLTQVSISGGSATYTGTFANGGSNAYVGRKIYVTGFTGAGNNGTFGPITSSSTTQIVVATTTQVNETHAGTLTPYTNGIRVGRFGSNFGPADTYTTAQLFADAFNNPSRLDILQIINTGGNIHYYLDYTGTAHGS
jgi:hypothetical protein